MTQPIKRLPVLAELPFAHLTMRLCAVPGGGLSFGLLTKQQAVSGAGVDVCGFVDHGTADQLRRIADAIEAAA